MWWFVAAVFVSVAISFLLIPKPKTVTPAIGEVTAATAEEGREIPVLFGTREISGPNIVWYGDIRALAITVKSEGKK